MKLSTFILTIFSVAVAPALADHDCEDGKGKVHIGNGKTATCRKIQNFIKDGRDQKVTKICETNDLGPNNEPPANEVCTLSCDSCDSDSGQCMSLFYDPEEYENNYVMNYLNGSSDCVEGYDEDTMLCSGDTFTVSPVSLYWDPQLNVPGGFVTAAGSIVNAIAEAPIAMSHGSIVPNIPEAEGKLFWQDLEDWNDYIFTSAITGATGDLVGFMGTATFIYSDMPYVELKICFPEDMGPPDDSPRRKLRELVQKI